MRTFTFRHAVILAALSIAPFAHAQASTHDADANDLGVAAAEDTGDTTPTDPSTNTVPITVHGRVAFELDAGKNRALAVERSKAAALILARLIDEGTPGETAIDRSPQDPHEYVLRIGKVDVVGITSRDIVASGIQERVYLESLRARLQEFVDAERSRATMQRHVLAISMAVFLALLGLALLRFVHRRREDARAWVETKALSLGGLHIRDLQILSAEAVEGSLYLIVAVAGVVAEIAVVYAYLYYTLSQFDSTRSIMGRLTHYLLSPFSTILHRFLAFLPAIILSIVFVYVVGGLLGMLNFFVDHLADGRLKSRWLPQNLATPARPILRVVLVVLALLVFGPLVSGNSSGILSRLGFLALAAIALAAVPLIAAAVAGAVVLFTRHVVPGQWVQIGRHIGEVTQVTFLGIEIVPASHGRVTVPHLVALLSSVRYLPSAPAIEAQIPVSATVAPETIIALIKTAAAPLGDAEVSLHAIDARTAVYAVRLEHAHPSARSALLVAITHALAEAHIALGERLPS